MTTTLPADPVQAAGLRDRVDAALSEFLDHQEQRYRAMPVDPAGQVQWQEAISTLRAFLAGGKRLRPAFCYWGWRGAGGDPDDDGVISAAAALELLHAFALIHDDIIDASDTRRGAPSLHRRHAELHRRSGLRGSPELFGTSVALLLGDLCLAWYHELLGAGGLAPHRYREAAPVVSQQLSELVLGQYLDVAGEARPAQSVDGATTVIHYKTAKYTVERPLHLGGILAGASPQLLEGYSDYAMPLGEAFQLRDDVLGAFGDARMTGKPVGDDLRDRKATVLLAITRRRASGAQLRALDELFGDPVGDAEVARLQEIIADSGALAECERRIAERTRTAREALAALPVPAQARSVLEGLLAAATERAR